MKLRDWLEELRRRRVVRAAIGYAAVLFVVLQVADIVVPALGLPDAVVTGLVVVGALGFPIAMALAWSIDLTPEGLERAARPATATDAPVGASDAPAARSLGSALALAAAVVVVAGTLWWVARPDVDAAPAGPAAPDAIRSLAVLPLANLTGTDEQRHFVDGMHDLLIGELAHVEGLSVISQRSVMRFRDSDLPMASIADTLGVQALIEGSVFRQGDSVRVTARLVQPYPEEYLWQAEYGGRLSEAMAVQARVARAVAEEIRIALTSRTQTYLARDVRGVDPEAMDAYLVARDIWKARDPARMQLAIDYFERAVELDSLFALGWAGVADGYTIGVGYDALRMPRDDAVRRGEAAIERALALEPGLVDAIAARGAFRLYLKQDHRGAVDDLSRVIELSPSHAQAHDWLGDALAASGRTAEAVRHFRRAVDLDPLSALMHRDYARGLYQTGDCDAALREAERALELDPDHLPAADIVARCKLAQGRTDEAVEEYLAYLADSNWGGGFDLEALRRAWETDGLRGFLLEDGRQLAPAQHILAAMRYADAGAADAAFEEIFASLEEREALVIGLRADPSFGALRGDPRWDEALRRLDALGEAAPRE